MPQRPNDQLPADLPSPTAGREDAITALAALYQGEKTDASYVFNTAMAMMGVAVAYIVGAISVIDRFSSGTAGCLFLLLLPLPLWLVAAFHSLMTLTAMSHGISVRVIEDALFKKSELEVERDLVGSAACDKIMDITRAKAAHVLTTLVVYGGIAFLVIGFTAYALYRAKEVKDNDTLIHARALEIAMSVYFLFAVMVAYSWIEGLRTINKGRSDISNVSSEESRQVVVNTQLNGSHRVLSRLPIWASSIIFYAVTMGVVYVARDFFEGLPYQVAYSAQFGDAALAGAVLIAATILQRVGPLPRWLSSRYFHGVAALVSVGLGSTWWSLDRPAHWGDIYHHLIIAPLIIYLAITLLPVILINGRRVEKSSVLCFALFWASLVAFDLTHGRMNQREWLQAHGVSFKHSDARVPGAAFGQSSTPAKTGASQSALPVRY
jgi:hypothetical protein